ncbi:hypothetical protein HDU67_001506 [Dinochytrium kinnereticum]|nr:hypothetical protein HDU67_001506 [Dinochytrium kinnereticum]
MPSDSLAAEDAGRIRINTENTAALSITTTAMESEKTSPPKMAVDTVTTEAIERPERPHDPSNPFDFVADDLVELIDPIKDPFRLANMGGVAAILKGLHVDPETGLHTAGGKSADGKGDVSLAVREKVFGPNVLPAVKAKSLLFFILRAMSDKILILLTVAAFVSLGVGLYQDFTGPADKPKTHWIEGFAIIIAVVIVVLAGSINDFQKEKAFQKLNAKKEDRKVKALRDSKTQMISIYHIVVGDILLLEPGDIIAADGIFISGMALKCDESAATGESDAIKKGEDADPFLLSGSKVNEGIGKYVVTGVGVHSFNGKTMMALRTEDEDTPLQVKLDGLAERIAKLGSAAAIFMFVVLFLKYVIVVVRGSGFGNSREEQESGTEAVNQLVKIIISAITVIVVAVPEGLPLAVTLALAFATTRMIKDNNLVRVLSACETMGGVTTICSDKTGTLTQNKMTVVTGVVGKNVMFQDEDEIKALQQRLSSLASSGDGSAGRKDVILPPRSTGKMDGPSADVLFDRVMEGVAINSSAFESTDEVTGEPVLLGSKTETALLEWCARSGRDWKTIRDHTPGLSVVQIYPFSSERKRMSTIVKIDRSAEGKGPLYRIHVKGASEIVLQDCDRAVLLPFSSSPNAIATAAKLAETGTVSTARKPLDAIPTAGSRSNPTAPVVYPIDQKLVDDYNDIINRFAEQSLRTICIAYRDFTEEEFMAVLMGPVRDSYLASKKEEREQAKKDAISKSTEGVIFDPVQPAPVTPTSPNFGTLPTTGSALLGVGDATAAGTSYAGSDVHSFATGSTDDEEPTEADLLAHASAIEAFTCKGLVCAAVVGIEDPLRPGVPEAVAACQGAGVFVRMVTGDNVLTARSIAERCGIFTKGGLVMEGAVFRRMPEEERKAILPRLQVLARSSPTDKQLLVAGLKELGETVAVTGDGTNDGPALKLADIGFSMGIAGTEVAKEASSIILMDDSFSSVVSAIMWGRSVNDSVRKFLQFQLSVNVSAVAITFISALTDPSEGSVLTAVQLLWVNLIMDSLAALALATERPTPELLNRPPTNKKAPLISVTMWKMIIGQSILQITVNLTMLFAGPSFFNFTELSKAGGMVSAKDKDMNSQAKLEKELIRTIVFNSFVFMQIFNMINCRRIDNKLNVFKRLFSNPYFYLIFIGVAIVQYIVVQFGDIVFNTTDLRGQDWGVCILIGALSLPFGAVIRLIPDDIFLACFGAKFEVQPTPSQVELQKIYYGGAPADGTAPSTSMSIRSENGAPERAAGMRQRIKRVRESFFSKLRGGQRRENAESS